MNTPEQQTLFAFDCGATNWRLYRAQYKVNGNSMQLVGEPSPSPLTSFVDRRLPAVIQLSPDGKQLECYGETAQGQIDNEASRLRIRDYFKPCIGAYLEANPKPHQLRFTHKQALEFTRMLLEAVLAQLLREKWRTGSFDERLVFTFAYPVHWQTEHEGVIFDEFSSVVRGCFPEEFQENIRFVSEPEGAILSLQRQGHLQVLSPGKVTLIIDVGGSTTDLVAGEVDPRTGELNFIGRYGEAFGGGHYDVAIANAVSDELLIPASAMANDPSALLSLRNVARGLKESLSRQLLMDENTMSVPQRTVTLVMRDGEIYRGVVRLEQDRFQTLTKNLSSEFHNLIETGLRTIGLRADDIGQVVLVGGGSQLFSIYGALKSRFTGTDLILADNPDESVVLGSSLEYGAAASKTRPSLLFMPGCEVDLSPTTISEEPAYFLESTEGDVFPLAAGENRVGRAPTNEIHIVGEKISRTHAMIVLSDESIEVIDQNSTNGTFVNGTRLEPDQPIRIQPGDEIRFGDKRLRIKAGPNNPRKASHVRPT